MMHNVNFCAGGVNTHVKINITFLIVSGTILTLSCLRHSDPSTPYNTAPLPSDAKQKFFAAISSLSNGTNATPNPLQDILNNPETRYAKISANQSLLTPRIRLVDKQGIVLAQLDPNLLHFSPEGGSKNDLYFQTNPLMDGDPNQRVRLVSQDTLSSRGFFQEKSFVYINSYIYGLMFKFLDSQKDWYYKNPLPLSQYSRMARDEDPFFRRQFSYMSPSPSCRSDSSGWMRHANIKVLSSRKFGLPNRHNVDVEVIPVQFHQNFKGGDKVEFKVVLNCKNSDQGSSHELIVAPALVTIQELVDNKVDVDGFQFRTSEANGYLDSAIFGRDPSCVVGRTVFDSNGHIYGVVTAYNPNQDLGFGDLEFANNLVITTIKDERLGSIISAAYNKIFDFQQKNLARTIDSQKPIVDWSETPDSDRFDPVFLQSIQDNPIKVAILKAWQASCQSGVSLEDRCDQEFRLLTKALSNTKKRDSALPQVRPIRPDSGPHGPITCRYFAPISKVKVPACPAKMTLRNHLAFP